MYFKKPILVILAVTLGLATEGLFCWAYFSSEPRWNPGVPSSLLGVPFFISFTPIMMLAGDYLQIRSEVTAYIISLIIVAIIYSLVWLKILLIFRGIQDKYFKRKQ